VICANVVHQVLQLCRIRRERSFLKDLMARFGAVLQLEVAFTLATYGDSSKLVILWGDRAIARGVSHGQLTCVLCACAGADKHKRDDQMLRNQSELTHGEWHLTAKHLFAPMHLPVLGRVTALIHRFRPGTACRRQCRSMNNIRRHRPRDPCRAGGGLAATIARRLLSGLVLVACGAALAVAPPGELRLRLLDGPTGKPLAGSAVWIEVYVRQSGCSQDSCYGYRLDLTADGDGEVALPASSPEAAGRPITELRVSAAGHVERHVGPKALASTPPITLTLLRAPPDLADLRLRLVAAKTLAPLAGVPVHVEIAYEQVLCVRGPCVVANSSVDLTADAQGEVAFRPQDRVVRPTGYVSMTITAGGYPPLTVEAKQFAVPQPVTLVLGRDRPSSSTQPASR